MDCSNASARVSGDCGGGVSCAKANDAHVMAHAATRGFMECGGLLPLWVRVKMRVLLMPNRKRQQAAALQT
jgi:hypothetical protein